MSRQQVQQDDEAARERIATDLDQSLLVEAGAGSGKTTSMVNRMLALIRSGRAQMREIAAITFTNKAAAELRGRFRLRLEREAAVAAPGPERERMETALRQVQEGFIGTIHAFCGKLLRERPIEAGLDPAFREMDEAADREFRDGCWEAYLDRVRDGGEGEKRLEELLALEVNVEDLRQAYHTVSKYDDVHIVMQETERPLLTPLRDSLYMLVDEALPYIPATQPDKGWDKLQELIHRAVRHRANEGGQGAEEADQRDLRLLALVKLFDKDLKPTQNRWTDAKMAKKLGEDFDAWRIDTLKPCLRRWREYLHPKIISFVRPAVEYNRLRRMQEGMLNFQDLLARTAELLRMQPEVRRYFARRYTRLFVDEFQDTDPIQAEMMLLLTGALEAESDWRQQQPRPGSLFVVGDPKQSIYRFRRADISTYNFVKQRLAEYGDVLQLARNFRSTRSIGDYVNYAFESVFTLPGAGTDYQAPYVRMITAQPNPANAAAQHGVYTMTVPKQDRHKQADIVAYDTERVAQYIAWACDGNLLIQERSEGAGTGGVAKSGPGTAAAKYMLRPARPSDFLVLLHGRDYIHRYAEVLERYGVPADTSGSRIVSEELRTLAQLALALADPTDRVPLLAVVRGALFGISDDALYHYRYEVGALHLYATGERELAAAGAGAGAEAAEFASDAVVAELQVQEGGVAADGSDVSEGTRQVLAALAKLREYAQWVRDMPAIAALARMVDDIGLLPAAAVAESGAFRSGTLVKVLELLQGDPEARSEWAALAERLRSLASAEEELEGVSVFAGSGEGVRIMNLHRAKGLEAPVVLLACPCGYNDHDASEHIDRMAEPPSGYFTVSKKKDAFNSEVIAEPAGWTALSEHERDFMLAERDRLLYVAATRAKQLLIVSQYPDSPRIDPWSPLGVSLKKQLELDWVPVAPAQRERLEAAPDAAAELAELGGRLAAGAEPSYAVASVTSLAKGAGRGAGADDGWVVGAGAGDVVVGHVAAEEADSSVERDVWREVGSEEGGDGEGRRRVQQQVSGESRGMAYGNLVHRSLQALGEGLELADLPDFLRLVAEEEGIVKVEWLEQAEVAVRGVMASELWQRALASPRRYHEFSFQVWREQGQGQGKLGTPFALRGVIDLVFEEADGWVIVDFKTDRYELGQEQRLVDVYRSQVLAYKAEWGRLTGGLVKEVGLYLVSGQRFLTGDFGGA